MTWELESLDEVTSTMSVGRDRAEAGAVNGTTVLAKTQTSGRGRRGRSWYSPTGGVYMTTIIRPSRSSEELPQLALVAGTAVRAACAQFGAEGARVKWPNDVVVGRKKLAGVLLETLEGPVVLVGVGANRSERGGVTLDSELTLRFIGLGDLVEHTPSRCELARAIVDALETRYHLWAAGKFDQVLEEFERFHVLTGQRVSAGGDRGPVEGVVTGLDPSGALILDTQNGRERVSSGEVHSVRPAR